MPSWMTESTGGCQCLAIGSTRRESAIKRTLTGLSQAVIDSVYSEQIAIRPGLLQKTDPRVKTAGLFFLLLAASFVFNLYILLAFYAVTLVLAKTSDIPLRFFIKRIWLFIPLFAGIIALPSIFNVVRPGTPIWTIWDFGGEVTLGPWSLGTSLAVTSQGVEGAVRLVLRVATSVSLAVLLALTTRWSDLLKALRVFFVPRIFILILSLTYRYIFLLLNMSSEMFNARTSRMVGPSSPREDRHFVASSMGTLLGKSHALSDEVYSAMVSRGYNGEPMSTSRFRMRGLDWALLAGAILTGMAAIGGDRFLG